tara:strand:+ start:137 stop:367 length:231 start_codon:yes stop_codon:yes gene_type:complete
MLYQLPSGKIVYLTLEEYLNMSDRDFHEQVIHGGRGENPPHPSKPSKHVNQDDTIEYRSDSDDPADKLDIKDLPDQ